MIQEKLYRIWMYGDQAPKNCIDRKDLYKLKKRGLVAVSGQMCYLTLDGSCLLEDAFHRPYYNSESERKFRYEVLTGTDLYGDPTKISRAVLPKVKKKIDINISEPDIDIILSINRLHKKLKKSRLEIALLIAEEKVRYCQRCEKLELFHIDSPPKICPSCAKKLLKNS